MTTPKLDLVMLYVADAQSAAQYFTEKLGFELIEGQSGPDFCWFHSPAGGQDFAIFQAGEHTPPAGAVHFYFKTPDLSGLREELGAKGLSVTPIEKMPFGDIFNVSAPDNHLLTMMA